MRFRMLALRFISIARLATLSALALVVIQLVAMPVASPAVAQSEIVATTTIYLVRHAEKRADQGSDPDLTRAGRNRARSLARILGNEPIDRVYSSEYRRTHLTVLPLSVRLGLPIYTVDAADGARLLDRLKTEHRGDTILVCGHSDTVPGLISGLGVRETVEIPDDRYGDLFVVKITGGRATLERRTFGR